MPFIKISSLPNNLDKSSILCKLEKALYDKGVLPQDMATCIWSTNDCVVHRQTAYENFENTSDGFSDLIFVDLYLNTILNEDAIRSVMETIWSELGENDGINRDHIFIQVHVGAPGRVLINNKIWTGGEV